MGNVEPNLYYISAQHSASANILRTILQSFISNIKPNYTISSIVKGDLSDTELIFILDKDPFKIKHLEKGRIKIFSRVNQLKAPQ